MFPSVGANAVSVLCDNDYTILIRFDTVQLTTDFFSLQGCELAINQPSEICKRTKLGGE